MPAGGSPELSSQHRVKADGKDSWLSGLGMILLFDSSGNKISSPEHVSELPINHKPFPGAGRCRKWRCWSKHLEGFPSSPCLIRGTWAMLCFPSATLCHFPTASRFGMKKGKLQKATSLSLCTAGVAQEASWPKGAGPGSAAPALGLTHGFVCDMWGFLAVECCPFWHKADQWLQYLVDGWQHTITVAMPSNRESSQQQK